MPLLATESRASRPCGARSSVWARRSAPASQPCCGYVEFVDRALGDQRGQRHRTRLAQRIAAHEQPLDTAAVLRRGEEGVGEDDDARRVEPGLHEVERAQRPCGLDEFGDGRPSCAAERVALEPYARDDPGRGAQVVGDAAGAARGDPVAAEVQRLDLGARGDRGGTLVPEPVGAEQQMPYGRRSVRDGGHLGEGLGHQRRAPRAESLLAQVEAPVGQRRTGREVQPLTGRTAVAQPGEQRGEFGQGARHDRRYAREGQVRIPLRLPHHCASW
jgi:hypothetical protein